MGFSISKAQIRRVTESLDTYLKNKLKFDVSKRLLSYTCSNKIKFLGFDIQRTPSGGLKCFKNKKLETYKRYQKKNVRKKAQNCIPLLKAAEWMGREAIVGAVIKKIAFHRYTLSEKELKEKITKLVPQEHWFYYRRKSNKKMELALKMRYDEQFFKLAKWIHAEQNVLNLRNRIKLTKVLDTNFEDKRMHEHNNVTKLKYEKVYLSKLQWLEKNSMGITSDLELASMLKILSYKKQILKEFRRKGVLNPRGVPDFVIWKTILSDVAIVRWYSIIGRRLLSYYGCLNSFNDINYQVNRILRYSLFETIGVKYNKSVQWIIFHFGYDPKIRWKNQFVINFPSLKWINSRWKKYRIQALGWQSLGLMSNSNLLCLSQTGIVLNSCRRNSV
jgi:Type II intron maturase